MTTTVHHPEDRLDQPDVAVTGPQQDADTEHEPITVPAPRDAADDVADAGDTTSEGMAEDGAAPAAAEDPPAELTDESAATEAPPVYPIYEVGTRLDVKPGHLVVGPNVRAEVTPLKGFIVSIRTFGVLHPIRVYQDLEGHLIVEDGKCRTVVAVDEKRPTVPIEIIEVPSDVARIYQQLTQNDDRHEVTTADRARAYQQLALLGEKPGRIARQTGRKIGEVKALVKVGASAVATQAAAVHGLDLLQAEAVAEFEDDPDAHARLIAAASGRGYQGFDHVLQRLRDDRKSAARKAALHAQCEAEGLRIVEDAGYGFTEQELFRIGIRDDEGIENHRTTCPGHAVVLHSRHSYSADGPEWYAAPVCVDPAANGHKLPESTGIGEPKKKLADMTEEEAQAARAERRMVRENNLAWQSATKLRREWIAAFADRTRIPPGAELFVLGELLQTPWYLLDSLRDGREILGKAMLTGKEADRATTGHDLAAAILGKAGGNAKRAVVQMAALIFSAWENHHGADDRGKDTWRRFDEHDTRVLRQMEQWGYELSEVERLVAHPAPKPTTVPTDGAAQSATEAALTVQDLDDPSAAAGETPGAAEAADENPAGSADQAGPAVNDSGDVEQVSEPDAVTSAAAEDPAGE
jgi:ParB family chromosome partitioning protein